RESDEAHQTIFERYLRPCRVPGWQVRPLHRGFGRSGADAEKRSQEMREDELIEQIKRSDEAGKAAGACRLVAQLVYPLDQRVQMGLMKNIQVVDDEIQTDRANNYREHQSELSLLHDIDGRG